MLTNQSEHAGANVASAGNLMDGHGAFRTKEPVAVACDFELANRASSRFIQSVRDRGVDRLSFTSAIALTAAARPYKRVKAIKAGINTYFANLREPVELVFAIANLTNRIQQWNI